MLFYYYVFKNFPAKKQGYIRTLALMQGVYFFVTGAWAIIDINSFMAVTGPKVDVWLVKMVGALTVAISLLLFLVSVKQRIRLESIVLILGASISYLTIDLYYSLGRVISYVYLGDAVLQIIFIIAWVLWLMKIRFRLGDVDK